MWLLSCSPATISLGKDDSGKIWVDSEAEESEELEESQKDSRIESIPSGDTGPQVEEGPDELLYEPQRVLEFQIELDQNAYNDLRWDGHSYVDATLSYGDWSGPVQIHIKGSSSWQEIDEKPSLVVDVDNRTPGFELMGEEKFYLHNQCYDPSMYSETLSYRFYREWGYPASRTNFARLTLNGEDYGFYTVVEPHEDEFLRQWFSDAAGNLYENAEAYCDVWDLPCMEIEEEDEGNHDAFQTFGNAARTGDWVTVKSLLNYEQFIDYLALEAGISHWDSYSYDLSNYKLYHEPTLNQWTMLTQSMDLDYGWRPWSFPNCAQYAMDPGTYTMGALAELCQNDPECHTDFVDAVERIADFLEQADGASRVQELDALYREEVRSDNRRYYGNNDYEEHISCLQGFFADRPGQLRDWVAGQRGQ
jgi:hypothetical protein